MKKTDAAWMTFETSLGICGVSWDSRGVTSFCLPEASERHVCKLLQKVAGTAVASSAPPAWVKKLVRKVKEHMKGWAQDFSAIPLHLDGPSEFSLSVYRAAQNIPSGKVVTYGELAALIGRPGAARAVGSALGKNPIPLIVPCHRVIASSGKPGGFSAPGGVKTKAALLGCEGVSLKKAR